MALQCPAGHPSQSDDYCDVCGSPMDAAPSGAAPASAPSQPSAPTPSAAVCPNCQVNNLPEALFCEACGYDFTTGTMPRPIPSILDLDAPMPAPSTPQPNPVGPAVSQPSAPQPLTGSLDLPPMDAPSPMARPPMSQPSAPSSYGSAAPASQPSAAPVSQPSAAPVSQPSAAPVSQPSGAAAPQHSAGPAQPEHGFEWVAELWIDPEWYALQQSPDPMPSPGLPTVVPLRGKSFLIGRTSRSRNVKPEIECGSDSGISRRQSELTTDGSRWFIEDLDSANGTYVAAAASPLPTQPIPNGRRHELNPDDRIFLGAWTRLVLRRATPEEVEAYA